jgi:hypothetical protein
MNHTKISKILVVLFAVVLCFGPVGLADPIGTAFTYQGRLIDANKAADGLYDLQFKLFDSQKDKSVYSYMYANSYSAGYVNGFQYFWTEQPISTDCTYVTLYISGDSYTISDRYAWHIAIVFTDDVNTVTDTIRCDCWGENEGCNPNHYDYFSATTTGADGRTWKRYTRQIPSQINKHNLTIKIEHEQASWDYSIATSWYRLDEVYLSDAGGNLCQTIENGSFIADAPGTSFDDITGWNHSLDSAGGNAEELQIVADYFLKQSAQLGQTIVEDNVDMLDGYFTAELDFGNVFDGNERWLEIGVRPGEQNDPNTYTALEPRQKVTAAPYALYAKTAGNAGGGSDWTISDNNMYSGISGNVGIGTSTPAEKLTVSGGTIKVVNNAPLAKAVWGNAGDGSGMGTNFGGYFEAHAFMSQGVLGSSTGAYGIGVNGIATGSYGTGVRGYGTQFDFFADGPGVDYGYSSSIRWKRDIRPIDNPLDKIMNLRGVYFDWDAEHGGSHDVGMIAEEVGRVLPEIVRYEQNGADAIGMDYGKVTPLLVEAVKDLKSEVDRLRQQNTDKDAAIKALEDSNRDLQNRLAKVEKLMVQPEPKPIGGIK